MKILETNECFSSSIGPIPDRIFIVGASLVAGGAERQIVNTAIGLRARGHCDVTVLVNHLYETPGHAFYLDQLRAAGSTVRQVGRSSGDSEIWQPAHDDGFRTKLERLYTGLRRVVPEMANDIVRLYVEFHRHRPAVVHAWLDYPNVTAGIAAVLAGVPRVLISGRNVSPVHFPYLYIPAMRAAYQALLARKGVVFINNSFAGATDYAEWLDICSSRVTVVYNGVDSSGLKQPGREKVQRFRQSLGISMHALLVGGMFRFSEEKRPMLWLEAARRVTSEYRDAYFVIFGGGPCRAKMEHYIAQHGLGERVLLREPVSDHTVALSCLDLLLITSKWEGTPNVALESQWVGTPVVATGGGGMREAIKDRVTGVFVSTSNVAAIATAVVELLRDNELRRHMGAAGRRFVEGRFSHDRMISETLRLYGLDQEMDAVDSGEMLEHTAKKGTCDPVAQLAASAQQSAIGRLRTRAGGDDGETDAI